jgi:endonuclease/exonuclease/phosphatase family metal-dependent hydrolase
MYRIARTGLFLALVVGLLVGAQRTRGEDRRPDASRLIVMTFNTEFMWDGVEPEAGQVDFAWKGSPSEAGEHMRRIATVIRRADPDIVNLVEVENLDALKRLNDEFLPGRGYRPYLQKGTDTYTGQNVALLTRIDPENDTITYDGRVGHSGTVSKSCSKNYVARFTIGADKLALVGLHLLAGPNRPDRRLEREAQADALRSLALEQAAAGYSLIILGDFNDYDWTPDYQDHIGSQPVSNVLAVLRGLDPATTQDDLVNACHFVPPAERYTAYWDQNDDGAIDPLHELTSIDHVLLAPTLAARVRTVQFPHDSEVRDNANHVSDHYPVVVQLQLGALPVPSLGLRIVALLPNPAGDETVNESVTLKNTGTATVNLDGWTLRDAVGRTWQLAGTLAAGQQTVVKRNGQPMALNNGGDTIDLIDHAGCVSQTVTYGRCHEDEVVTVE